LAVTLTGYGGVGEIGGNAFRLADGRSELWLDFGKRFGADRLVESRGLRPGWNDYFDQYLRPRNFRYVHDLMALGLIPARPDLYRQDLGGAHGPAPAAAVVLSHPHQDHCGLIGLLKPSVPVIATPAAQRILASMEETGGNDPEGEFLHPRMKGRLGRTKDGDVTARPLYKTGPARSFGAPELDGWSVEPHAVDHSIPGAAGYVVSWAGGSLAYTGDFRLHGRDRHLSERFVERIQGVDVLVTEGTNVHGGEGGHGHEKSTDREESVEATIEHRIREADARGGPRFVGVGYPPRDLDRFHSILRASRRVGRRFAITLKQAHLLDSMRAHDDSIPDPFNPGSGICVYLDAGRRGTILHRGRGSVPVADPSLNVVDVAVDDAAYRELLLADYPGWEGDVVTRATQGGTAVCALDIGAEPAAYVFSINYWTIKELFDIFPDPAKAGGLYIHSQTQPFNDDMEASDRKLERWLRCFRLERANTHVSGHLGPEDLDWVLDLVRARTLVPVHSLHPDLTASRYEARTGMKAMLPSYGAEMHLG
jgi:ribonuclease J